MITPPVPLARRTSILLSLSLIFVALWAACAPRVGDDATRDPFRSRTSIEEGLAVTFEGLAQGHSRGSVSTFRLQLTNPTPDIIDVSYCLLLIGGGFSSQLLFERRSLDPVSSVAVEIVVLIPEQIAPGAYELGLVLPDQMYLGTTIYVESGPGSPLPPRMNQPTECAPAPPERGAP